jgi:phosphatidyl-myo-inositol dimannoside synthase
VQDSSVKVLALVTEAFGGHGGIAQYNRDLLSSLAKCDGVGEVVVLPRLGAAPERTLPCGVRQLHPPKNRLTYILAALRAARSHGPFDVVFCGHLFMAPLGAAIAKLIRAPLWIQVHGFEAWRELSMLHRRSVEMAAVVTSVSRYTRQRLLKWVGVEPSQVKVLPNTVGERFRPGPKPRHLLACYGLHEAQVLMTVSRLTKWDRYKGHDRVIRALPHVLSQHPNAVYVVVGEGDDRGRLEAVAAELGMSHKVRFTGAVTPEELPAHFQLADVFVMPSTGEGFGIVFLEAMACGVPVIGGNGDGSRDALCGSALAAAVEPDNCEELVAAIHIALSKPLPQSDHTERFKLQHFEEHLNAILQMLYLRNRAQ